MKYLNVKGDIRNNANSIYKEDFSRGSNKVTVYFRSPFCSYRELIAMILEFPSIAPTAFAC